MNREEKGNMILRYIIGCYLLFFSVTFSQSVPNSNKKGIEAYNKKDYPKAIEYFSDTLKSSPNDAYANYNLACVYAILLSQCEDIPGDDLIFKLLKKAIKNKPSYKSKLLNDEDFNSIKEGYRFQELAGKSKRNILTSITWYGPSPGAYGPIDQFQFKEDGTFLYSKINLEGSGPMQRDEYQGVYTWDNDHQFQIQFLQLSPFTGQTGKYKSHRVKYSEGLLEIQGFEHSFSDSKDSCSA